MRRADIEYYARDLEERGRARATVVRRLRTVAGFYRYAEQEGLLERFGEEPPVPSRAHDDTPEAVPGGHAVGTPADRAAVNDEPAGP